MGLFLGTQTWLSDGTHRAQVYLRHRGRPQGHCVSGSLSWATPGSLSRVPWDVSPSVGVRFPVRSRIVPELARSRCVFPTLVHICHCSFWFCWFAFTVVPVRSLGALLRRKGCLGCQEGSFLLVSSVRLPFCRRNVAGKKPMHMI